MSTCIPELLVSLVSNSVYYSSQNSFERALRNRFIGFRAELEFADLCSKFDHKVLEGGYIIPLRSKKKTLDAPIYFTADSRPFTHYKKLYTLLNKANFAKLFYIQFDNTIAIEKWEQVIIDDIVYPSPNFKVYDFQNNSFIELSDDLNSFIDHFTRKNNYKKQIFQLPADFKNYIIKLLSPYSYESLLNTYVTRLIFDGYIGFKRYKGISSDIDLIREHNSSFRFYEVKEKDLSKTHPVGFGIDVQRLVDCLTISRRLNTEYIYAVRQIDNQKHRKFISWRFIDLAVFESLADKNIIKEGGAGMNTVENSPNPTLLVEERHFKKVQP